MFSLPFDKSNLILDSEEWDYVEQLIKKPSSTLVYEEGQIESKKLLALGSTLQDVGHAMLRLHVYHKCNDDAAEIRNWTGSFTQPDEKCPVCSNKYGKSVRYDIEVIIKYPLYLTDGGRAS